MAEVVKNISATVDRFEQQLAFYCGAACSQMVLKRYNMDVVQAEAFQTIHTTSVEPGSWQSDPRAIATFLSNKLSAALSCTLVDVSTSEPQAALDRILYTINILSFPPAVLVYEGGHWVVVHGVRISEAADGARKVIGVWVQDPWFREPPNQLIPISDFLDRYLKPNKFGVQWKDKYVLISDNATVVPFSFPSLHSNRVAFLGGGGMADATVTAITGLNQLGFAKVKPLGAGGAAHLPPTLVSELDTGLAYTLVPVDAADTPEFGDYVYVAIREAGSSDTAVESEVLAVAKVSQCPPFYTDEDAVLHLQALYPNMEIVLTPGYFWKPCQELRSRFSVARKFSVNGIGGYLLPFGQVVDQLHDFNKGA